MSMVIICGVGLTLVECLLLNISKCRLLITEETDERLKPKGNESYIDFDDDDNGDIPVIPNLEEVQEEVRYIPFSDNSMPCTAL